MIKKYYTTWGSTDIYSITCSLVFVGTNSLNGCSGLNLLKGNKKRKLHKARVPTTVDSLEVDAYAVDIKRVENPFVKDNEDSDDEDSDDDNDAPGHLPKLSTNSVSHAKIVHNAKEKKRYYK